MAVCILRVGLDYGLQALTCLDAPHFRSRRIVEEFWRGVGTYKEKYKERVKLVTFNGRGFDLPLLELAAFRYEQRPHYFLTSRNRFGLGNVDLMDGMTNFGAVRMAGGLDVSNCSASPAKWKSNT